VVHVRFQEKKAERGPTAKEANFCRDHGVKAGLRTCAPRGLGVITRIKAVLRLHSVGAKGGEAPLDGVGAKSAVHTSAAGQPAASSSAESVPSVRRFQSACGRTLDLKFRTRHRSKVREMPRASVTRR
jgi:hypothetical protein